MVIPNWWKNLPMMPPMKPIGKNTATIDKVVAKTAKPISLVPSIEASYDDLPICTCRTMFSRTTMASSINKPTHKLSAIKVTLLMVNPNQFMNKNVPMMEIGNVNPVMTVERHEFKNKNTLHTVSKAPSINVRRTLSTATRMGRELSLTGSRRTLGGNWAFNSASVLFKPSTTSMVFSSCDFCTVIIKVR